MTCGDRWPDVLRGAVDRLPIVVASIEGVLTAHVHRIVTALPADLQEIVEPHVDRELSEVIDAIAELQRTVTRLQEVIDQHHE